MATRKKTRYSDGTKKKTVTSQRRTKVVLKEKGKKKVKQKVKYNKDGTIKKVVSKIGGKRVVDKTNRDTPKYKRRVTDRKIKLGKKEKGKKRDVYKVKYKKDGSVKKVVVQKGGKRYVEKYKKYKNKNYKESNKPGRKVKTKGIHRDTPLAKSDW